MLFKKGKKVTTKGFLKECSIFPEELIKYANMNRNMIDSVLLHLIK